MESKTYASNPAVVVEYLKALVATERLNEYADSSSSKGATGTMLVVGGATPAPGQDHRSLLALLKELQGLAGGGAGGSSEAPGSSLRRPLHVVLQVRVLFFEGEGWCCVCGGAGVCVYPGGGLVGGGLGPGMGCR